MADWPLSPFGEGWKAASEGEPITACPYTSDELDVYDSESRGEPVLSADRWRAGWLRFHS